LTPGLERETQRFNYNTMKEDFIKSPHEFLVNQLVMSIQFFRNFER
jgi:hypothetical protein